MSKKFAIAGSQPPPKNKKSRIVFWNPMKVFGVFLLVYLLVSWFNMGRFSNFLFVTGIVAVNLCWIYLTRNIKTEDKEKRKEKDLIGYALLFFSGLCFGASLLFGTLAPRVPL
ncbi:MAG TPA: hypothetical protein P5560_08035 [Thermotogota bacterium]|nr:hypothetical protein [Thermotogota bacterium]HRW92875.1 hypothetical protein [Thermotogota bacterium]